MKLNLKYKCLRIINFGIHSVENFNDKKNIQIYNTFLLLVFLTISFYGILLFIYQFYYQIIFIALSYVVILIALYLNYINKISLSKIFVIQSFILYILTVLCVFSFDTVFTLYFFLIILYSTLIFTAKETKIKLFFIIQCFLFFFIALTSYKTMLPNFRLLPRAKIADMNFISIIDFIIFLFTYIYFHTSYQHYKEKKYNTLNTKLYQNNLKIKYKTNNKRKIVTITSNLLNDYLNRYSALFKKYSQGIQSDNNTTVIIENDYVQLNNLNRKIEEVINYQFSKDKNSALLTLEKQNLFSITKKILDSNFEHICVSKTKIEIVKIHYDLYAYFLIELIKDFSEKYNSKTIHIELKTESDLTKISPKEKVSISILGIQVYYQFLSNKELNLVLYFFKHPDQTAIYDIKHLTA